MQLPQRDLVCLYRLSSAKNAFMSLTKARATPGGRLSGLRVVELDFVETLKALREELKELLQVILVADRSGFCAEHNHRLPRDAVNRHLYALLRATIHVEQVRKDQGLKLRGSFQLLGFILLHVISRKYPRKSQRAVCCLG